MNYRLSKKAEVDLQGIWLYTNKNWSLEQADVYVRMLLDEMERLAANPGSGRDRSDLRKNYKCSQVKSHLIFYQTISRQKEIEIIRILHKQMDIENRLGD